MKASWRVTELEPFFAEHRRLRECTAEMAALAERSDPPDMAELNDARWRFARALLRTLTLKERMVYPRLRVHPDPLARAIAARFDESTAGDYAKFAEHSRRFPPDAVVLDWRAYAHAVRSRCVEAIERLDREEAELFPLIDSAPRVSPGSFATGTNWAADAWRVRELLGMDGPGDRAA